MQGFDFASLPDTATSVSQASRSPLPGLAKHIAAGACVFLVACLTYSNADHDRLFFDSLQLSEDPLNPLVRDIGQALHQLRQSGLHPGQDLTVLTFAANYAWNVRHGLAGLDPTGFLVVNVLLHAAISVLLYYFILAFQRSAGSGQTVSAFIPLVCAALFAVHPLTATSVVYILQRRGLMAAFFYIVGLLSYLRLRSARWLVMKVAWGLLIALSFVLGMKSNKQMLTLPVALLALAFCLIPSEPGRMKRYLRWALPLACLCAVGLPVILAIAGWFDLRHFRFIRTVAPADWGAWSQFFTQMRVLAVYWKLILLPWPGWLCIDHPFRSPERVVDTTVLVCLVMHAGLVIAAILAARRGWRLAGFGLLLYYIGFIPWLFAPQGEQLVEYKTYLSSIGVFLFLAELLERATARIRLTVLAPAMLLVVLMLFATTRQRNKIFKDPILLWQDVIAKYPTDFRGYVSLGVSYADIGRYSEAMDMYRRADQIQPYNASLHYYMGNALRNWGQLKGAVAEYREAHRIAGGDLPIVVCLGNTLAQLGRRDEAIAEYRAGLALASPDTLSSDMATARFNLANQLAGKGMLAEAVEEYRHAIESNSNYANAYYGLGLVLGRQNRPQEALEALYTAMRIRPDFPEAQRAVQDVLAKQSAQPP